MEKSIGDVMSAQAEFKSKYIPMIESANANNVGVAHDLANLTRQVQEISFKLDIRRGSSFRSQKEGPKNS